MLNSGLAVKTGAAASAAAASSAAAAAAATTTSAPSTPTTPNFVRSEKPDYPEEIKRQGSGSEFMVRANAAVQLGRSARLAELAKSPAAAKVHLAKVAQLQHSLELAASGDEDALDHLMQLHATSSASSPLLSGTASFTVGENSQAAYIMANLKNGKPAIVTLHATPRALTNRHNSREGERLLPLGEKMEELCGALHVQQFKDKQGVDRTQATFIDVTGAGAVYKGDAAVAQFFALQGRNAQGAALTEEPAELGQAVAGSAAGSAAGEATLADRFDFFTNTLDTLGKKERAALVDDKCTVS